MWIFGKSKVELLTEKVDELEGMVGKLVVELQELKLIDNVPIINAIKASNNNIKATIDNSTNRVVNAVKNEFDSRMGKTVQPAVVKKEAQKEVANRKSRETKTIEITEDVETVVEENNGDI